MRMRNNNVHHVLIRHVRENLMALKSKKSIKQKKVTEKALSIVRKSKQGKERDRE